EVTPFLLRFSTSLRSLLFVRRCCWRRGRLIITRARARDHKSKAQTYHLRFTRQACFPARPFQAIYLRVKERALQIIGAFRNFPTRSAHQSRGGVSLGLVPQPLRHSTPPCALFLSLPPRPSQLPCGCELPRG